MNLPLPSRTKYGVGSALPLQPKNIKHTKNYYVSKLIEVSALVVTGIILTLIMSIGLPS